MHWHPLRFSPIYKERIWGDRSLARLYRRELPGTLPIGESWEITDRPEGVSTVLEGPLAGKTLSELLSWDRSGLLGEAADRNGRFPLLVKILAAHENLSVQVHPPARIATELGGESKTEMWYFTATEPGARIFAGLRPGITRARFEEALHAGTVGDCLHATPVHAGDTLFLPSGRIHALGAGVVLFEIQENSDTTYRVFDWNRLGLDGKPRSLHVRESLASIDFNDFSPEPLRGPWRSDGTVETRILADDPLFKVTVHRAPAGTLWSRAFSRCLILGMVRGGARIVGDPCPDPLAPGDFRLLPAALSRIELQLATDSEWLIAEPGCSPPPLPA
jgi:mannose-6-phosphate isomerase